MPAHSKRSINLCYHDDSLTRATRSRLDHSGSPGTATWYPPSVTGVGLGPEEGTGALGVPWGLGDKAGRRVVRTASVELRPSVVTGGVALVWALTEAQQSRSISRSGGKPCDPMAARIPTRRPRDRALPGNRGGCARGITGRVPRGRTRPRGRRAGPGQGRPRGAGVGRGTRT